MRAALSMLALLGGASAFAPLSRTRAVPRRSAVTMKWGEDIGDDTFLRNPDGRPSQLQRDYGKLIITLATTGNINTRANNPDLPCSPKEMADDMHECVVNVIYRRNGRLVCSFQFGWVHIRRSGRCRACSSFCTTQVEHRRPSKISPLCPLLPGASSSACRCCTSTRATSCCGRRCASTSSARRAGSSSSATRT